MTSPKRLAAMGGGALPAYIEEIFQTWLYTGTGSTQTISNGIDLANEGGLVWLKTRASNNHLLFDTVRGAQRPIYSNSSTGQQFDSRYASDIFQSNGFKVGTGADNDPGNNYVSWVFRKKPKFLDVVTWTGNGGVQTINHSLGSVPGCIFIKATTSSPGSRDWAVWHRSIPTDGLLLNSTNSASAIGEVFARSVTSTSFDVDRADTSRTNENGVTFVAYVFAHDAGGFGLTGTDNVISCGSYTGNGSSTTQQIDLGYEPQWLLIRSSTLSMGWYMVDNMRGFSSNRSGNLELRANATAAEGVDFTPDGCPITLNATGFNAAPGSNYFNSNGNTYIYIAIRRGPMRTPTTGTSVYNAITRTGTGSAATVTGLGFSADLMLTKERSSQGFNTPTFDRLRGVTRELYTTLTNAESNTTNALLSFNMDGFSLGTANSVNFNTSTYVYWNFRRAPGFFDVVCYSGTDSPFTFYNHNLGVQPELIFVKRRNSTGNWAVAVKTGSSSWLTSDATGGFVVNSTAASISTSVPDFSFTSTTARFGLVGNGFESTELSSGNYVAYLFASCPGVSKVGSYTGNGSSQTINCGFTGGARFVLIKRTDSTGAWYVWDTARGIVSGNDPHLSLNTTAAEVTSNDTIDPDSSGFVVNQVAATNVNVSSATYIYLAIA
jgi:hypothetical protein